MPALLRAVVLTLMVFCAEASASAQYCSVSAKTLREVPFERYQLIIPRTGEEAVDAFLDSVFREHWTLTPFVLLGQDEAEARRTDSLALFLDCYVRTTVHVEQGWQQGHPATHRVTSYVRSPNGLGIGRELGGPVGDGTYFAIVHPASHRAPIMAHRDWAGERIMYTSLHMCDPLAYAVIDERYDQGRTWSRARFRAIVQGMDQAIRMVMQQDIPGRRERLRNAMERAYGKELGRVKGRKLLVLRDQLTPASEAWFTKRFGDAVAVIDAEALDNSVAQKEDGQALVWVTSGQ